MTMFEDKAFWSGTPTKSGLYNCVDLDNNLTFKARWDSELGVWSIVNDFVDTSYKPNIQFWKEL